MKLVHFAVCCIGIGAMVAGCAGSSGPGDRQSDVFPRLVKDKNNAERWDNAAAFGPVPADKAWVGQQHCSKMDTKDAQFKAIGYHEKALDSDAVPIRGGGFLCAKK